MRTLDEELRNPKSFLSACVLLLLAEAEGYGYELSERLREFGFDIEDPSHLYRVLRSLEAMHLVTSTWATPGGRPARRVYRITATGRASLARCAGVLDELRERLTAYVDRFERTALSSKTGGTSRPSRNG